MAYLPGQISGKGMQMLSLMATGTPVVIQPPGEIEEIMSSARNLRRLHRRGTMASYFNGQAAEVGIEGVHLTADDLRDL